MSDNRVAYLESQCNQLSDQIRTMKTLVATEVSDLKGVMQQQVGEIKQIVMHQDRLYNDRVRRLESRMEQMSDFTLQLARASGTSGTMHQLPQMDTAGDDGAFAGTRTLGGGGGGFDDYEDEFAGSAPWTRYNDKFNNIFDYYTTSNIKVFNSNFNLSCFSKMLKDCNIGGFNSGSTPEILWMGVLRRLEEGKQKKRKNKSLFAFERLGEIPRHNFGEAIYHLAQETVGKSDPSATPDEAFETFIARDFFPAVDDRLQHGQTTTRSAGEPVGSSSVEEYKTPEVKAVVKEYMSRLKESNIQSIQSAQNYGDVFMKLEGFVEFVRKGNLFSMISKPDINHIFSAIAAIEAEKNEGKKDKDQTPPGTITMPALMIGLYHLSERIYGDPLYADKYPTPESRVKKLLAKMYLLS